LPLDTTPKLHAPISPRFPMTGDKSTIKIRLFYLHNSFFVSHMQNIIVSAISNPIKSDQIISWICAEHCEEAKQTHKSRDINKNNWLNQQAAKWKILISQRGMGAHKGVSPNEKTQTRSTHPIPIAGLRFCGSWIMQPAFNKYI